MLDGTQARRIKQRLNASNLKLSEELTRDLYESSILPAALSWFGNNSSVQQLQQDIQDAVRHRWPMLQIKIESVLAEFEEHARMELLGELTGQGPDVDTQAIIATLNERVGQVVGALGTSFVAMICGGGGVALLAGGPVGIILGVIVGTLTYFGSKNRIEDWVAKNLLNKNVPAFAKSLVKVRVSTELKRSEAPFQQRLFEILQQQTRPIMDVLDAAAK